MKRILAFVVVLSVLLSVCSISAAAAPVYSVEADTNAVTPFALTALNAAVAADTGATLNITSAEMDALLDYYFTWADQYNNKYIAGQLLYSIWSVLQSLNGNVYIAVDSILTHLPSISTSTAQIFSKLSDFYTLVNSLVYPAITGITTAVTQLRGDVQDVRDAVVSGLGNVNTAVGNVNTSVGQVNTSVGALNSNLFSLFCAQPGRQVIGADGIPLFLPQQLPLADFLNYAFHGLRSLIAGSEVDNVYSLTLLDNNNESSSVNATGLGPMLNTSLNNLGENLAKLTFMFAADDDIQLKADSQPVLDEVTDTVFGSGSGKVKLDVSNVSDLTGMSDDVLGYFETGGQIGDINTVVNDDSTWLWFTSQTAADLDTTGSSLSRAAVEFEPEADSHTEWYASFYRDVLGRDYVGG